MKILTTCAALICISFFFAQHTVADTAYTFEDLPGPFWQGGAQIELRVVDADGEPVPGADVDMASSYRCTFLISGRPSHPDRTPDTDADGVFQLELADQFTQIVITHDKGVAIIGPEALIDQHGPMLVSLQPWSSVAGQLVDAQGRPLANQKVRLEIGHWLANDLNTSLQVNYVTTTDGAGRFTFDRVPPGEVRVAHYERGTGGVGTPMFNRLGRSAVGHAQPGQELKPVIGGGGRTVRGRLVAETPPDRAAGTSAGHVFVVPRSDPDLVWNTTPMPTPLDLPTWTTEKRKAWREAWDRSAQRLAFEKHRAELAFAQRSLMQKSPVQPDGTFDIPDVPPGEYILKNTFPDRSHARFPFDLTQHQPQADALDLGLLPIGSVRFGVGDHLPDFEMTQLPVDDPPVNRRFSDFKGRYVLVDFWATWCGPCLRESPNVQQVVKTFAGDDRLVVLCISLDRTPDRPTLYINATSAGGIQTWLSESQDQAVDKAFSIPGIPAIWLIGPDGKIIAQDLFGDDIMSAVAAALSTNTGG